MPTPATTPVIGALLPRLAEKAVYYTMAEGNVAPGIWRLDLETRSQTLLYHGDQAGFSVGSLALSPDEHMLAFTFLVYAGPDSIGSGLRVMRTDGQELRTLAETDALDDTFDWPVWSPDGTHLAYSRLYMPPELYPGKTSLHLVGLSTGQDKVLAEELNPFAWSPVSGKILCGRPDYDVGWSGLYLIDPKSGEKEPIWEDTSLSFGIPALQRGGKQIAVTATEVRTVASAQPDASLYSVDVATRERRLLANVDAWAAHWSPDGGTLAYSALLTHGQPSSVRAWLLDLKQGSPVQLLDMPAFLSWTAWSADGQALLMLAESGEADWISVMAVADRSLVKLVPFQPLSVFVIW